MEQKIIEEKEQKQKKGFELFYSNSKFLELLENLLKFTKNKQFKLKIQLDGKSAGEFDIPKNIRPEELKAYVEEKVQELLKQKDPKTERAHIVKIIALPEIEKKEDIPIQAPLALDVYVEPIDKTKEFEAQQTLRQSPNLIETSNGYYVIFSYPQEYPIEEIQRDYIPRKNELEQIEEILKNIKEPENKNLRIIITIEDYTKIQENQKIKEEIESKYKNLFNKITIEFKTLNCEDIVKLISVGSIKDKQLEQLKNGLAEAKTKENKLLWTEKEIKQIKGLKTLEEVKNFLEENKEKELYFNLEVRKKYPVIENVYEVYRKIQIYRESFYIKINQNLEVENDGKGKIAIKMDGKTYKPDKNFKIDAYINEKKNQEQKLEIYYGNKFVYKIIYVPKEKQFQEFKGWVGIDFSNHVIEFLGDKKEQLENYIKQQANGRMVELIKNEPLNYHIFFEKINKIFDKYFAGEALTENEKKTIEYIKEDGLTLVGDMAITDPNYFVERNTLNKFLYYCKKLSEKEGKNIKIRFLVVSPEEFRYGTKPEQKNTIYKRIEELEKYVGENFRKKEEEITKYYMNLKEEQKESGVELIIVWVNSEKNNKKLEQYLKELEKF